MHFLTSDFMFRLSKFWYLFVVAVLSLTATHSIFVSCVGRSAAHIYWLREETDLANAA